jgi:hypothetical protein
MTRLAQILGYLRASRVEHGLLLNFGAPKFEIKKYALSQPGQGAGTGGFASVLLCILAPFRGRFLRGKTILPRKSAKDARKSETKMQDIMQICDVVRETGFAIQRLECSASHRFRSSACESRQ